MRACGQQAGLCNLCRYYIYGLYFTDLEAEALEIADGSDLVWPLFINTKRLMQCSCV